MRKVDLIVLLFTITFFSFRHVGKAQEIELWPKGLPKGSRPIASEKAERLKRKNTSETIFYVDKPCLVPFLLEGKKNQGCAVVVCPGGGYHVLAWQKEGIEIAKWLNTLGINAFVLRYRVPRRDPEKPHLEPLQDAQRAMRLVRSGAQRWNLDPHRIGMLGFSAGGHLTITTALYCKKKTYEPFDAVDKFSPRPDFIIPIYPAYLGAKYRDDIPELGPLVKEVSSCPPTFIAVTWDDRMRAAQAALFFVKLKKADIPAELHVFAKGGHGYGMRPSPHPVSKLWPQLCAAWLKEMGFIGSKAKVSKQ